MKPKFIQVSVREQINTKKWRGLDYRQAEAVLKYKPDAIIFENACAKTPDTIYNRYSPEHKPVELVDSFIKGLKKAAKQPGMEYALSDVRLWKNIKELWDNGHNVLIYDADGPKDLRREFFEVWKYMYPCALKNWLWWVRIYLREKYMCRNVEWILARNRGKKDLIIAVFLQSFHWEHVKFLLDKPSPKKIREYYFGKFKEINRANVGRKIRENNKLFYKYWQKASDFAA